MKKIIVAEKAPAAIGPYSAGVICKGPIAVVSGQLPADPLTGELPEGIEAQTKQSLENVKAVLEAGGLSLEDVVEVTVLLKNMADFNKMNEVYGQYFTKEYPARCAFQVAALPKDALIEIRAVACGQEKE